MTSFVTDCLLNKPLPELLPSYLRLCENVSETQENVLLDILCRAGQSWLGQKHGFSNIRSVAEFRKRVPITTWDDYVEPCTRIEQGESNVLFDGQPEMFLMTTGTAGAQKLIPETTFGRQAKDVSTRLRLAAIFRCFPDLLKGGSVLAFANRAFYARTPSGIPYGTASGQTLDQSGALRERSAYPISILELVDDPASLDYLIMRFAMESDVRVIGGNNAGRVSGALAFADQYRDDILKDIHDGTIASWVKIDPTLKHRLPLQQNPERARLLADRIAHHGRLDGRAAWPDLRLLSCWLSGSIGRFVADAMNWLPEGTALFDCGYGASEGKFNIPLSVGNAAGPLALHAHLFEFMPPYGGVPCLAHEVEDGAVYRMLVTSYSGLYRYDIRDLVRIDGFTADCPNIVFLSKDGDIGNIVGEKISGVQIQREVDLLLAHHDLHARHYCVVADPERHGYDLCIELWPDSKLPDPGLSKVVDTALRDAVFTYRLFRGQKLLAPMRVRLMAEGWQDNLYACRIRPGISISQIKLPVVMQEAPAADMTLTILPEIPDEPD